MPKGKPLYEQVAERLIDQLEMGTSPFQKPWQDDPSYTFSFPYNPTTGNAYRGMNLLWLMSQDRADPRWLTFRQASQKGWSVKKGEKGSMITIVRVSRLENVLDDNGKVVKDDAGKPVKRSVKLDKPIISSAWVFNGEQVQGIPPLATGIEKAWEPIERAEQILQASRAVIRHEGNQAYYHPRLDEIVLPPKKQFEKASGYYATALHELGHWTGHASRLNRPILNKFGTDAYAREELRAEIASLMMGGSLQIGHEFGQHAAYVGNWVRILKDDPFEIFRASADAQKITDYLLALEQKRDVTRAQDTLHLNDVISYKDTSYKVTGLLRNKGLQLEDIPTGNRFRLTPDDGLYRSLIQAKTSGLDRGQINTTKTKNPEETPTRAVYRNRR